jgi:hypothetical protein
VRDGDPRRQFLTVTVTDRRLVQMLEDAEANRQRIENKGWMH